MEARLHFRVTNSAPVTAIVYHPLRREIVTGHEGQLKMINNSIRATPPISADGLIKCWEADTGKLSTIRNIKDGYQIFYTGAPVCMHGGVSERTSE